MGGLGAEEVVGVEVFLEAGEVVGGEGGEAADVEVVFEVVDFDHAADGVLLGAEGKLFVCFAGAFGDGENGVDNFLGEALAEQGVRGDVGVFNGVVEQGHDGFGVGGAAGGHSLGVEVIGHAGLVGLA